MNGVNRQRGISLVELLIAMVIGLFLLAGIYQVYISNKATFAFTNAIAEVQENGRFALDLMSQDLRMASEWGCIQLDPKDTANINDTLSATTLPGYDTEFHDFIGKSGIEGNNNTGLNNSDTLTIRGGRPSQANVEGPFFPPTSKQLVTDAVNSIGIGDIVLVARCGANDLLIETEADIFRVNETFPFNNNTQRVLTFSANKSQQFENDAMVIVLQTVNYFIAAGESGEPALFRREFGNAPRELIEGTEDLQILYGVDTDNDDFPNQYLTADKVLNFNDVVAVRVMLLVRSVDDNVTDTPQTYTYNGVTQTADDRRLRQSFSATVALRNRIGS
ncbi:MAG TPA: PilW family protein [Gammaproteobacteria bacterium]|jgi:type IV pilus assembly protein PilW